MGERVAAERELQQREGYRGERVAAEREL